MRILVVDDEAGMRTLLANLLELSGHTVRMAANGREAWDYLSAGPLSVDAVIADVKMPVMGGRELLEKIVQAGLGIPLILVTGQINLGPDDAALAGAFSIIHKPFELKELEQALERIATGIKSES